MVANRAPVVSSTRPAPDAQAACRDRLLHKGIFVGANDPCVDIDDLLGKLALGTYTFNKPESAYVDEPFQLVLTLATVPGQDVTPAFQGTEGERVERSARFAQLVEASVDGGVDFKIDPPGPQQRTATSGAPVVWKWIVTPLKAGKKAIAIDVAADLIIGTQKQYVQLRTLSEEIQISVGILHWFVGTFSGLWGAGVSLATMVIAVLGILHYLRERKTKAVGEPPPMELVTHRQHQIEKPRPPH
jgi:hypothetical protein